MAKRRWPYVLLGVAVLLVFIGIGAIIAAVAWFQQHLQVDETTATEASVEFDRVRQQFPGREPLLELHNGVPRYTQARESAPARAGKISTFHILVWDPNDEQLARITLPFWLLRLKSDPIQFSAYASGLDDEGVTLRPEDIERYGPGIVLDTTTRDGERVLLWTR